MQPSILKRSTPYLIFALAVLFALATALVFHRNNFRGLSTEALDCAQLARNIFRGEGFSTNLIPAETSARLSQTTSARGFNPDLSHAPLFPLFLGGIFAVAGEKDTVVAAFSLGLYVLSAALLFVLARRLTNNLALAFTAVVVFALSLPILGLADSGRPQALSGCFLLLSLLALTPKPAPTIDEEQRDDLFLEDDDFEPNPVAALPEIIKSDSVEDIRSDEDEEYIEDSDVDEDEGEDEESETPALSTKNYFVAGLMAALCYLSDPLALIFLVPLCFLWGRGEEGWKRPTTLAFLLGFVLFATPWWIRNLRLTGNPLYSQQWFALSGQGGGIKDLASNFKRGIGGLFYGVASIPHLYLMPFIVVAAWMSSFSPSLARFKGATLITLVSTIFILSLLGRGDTTSLLPLAPLLTLVGLITFKQIVSDSITHKMQTGSSSGGIGRSLLLAFLTICNLRILKAEILARQSYQATTESEIGAPALDGGRWPRRKVQLAQSFALLLLILALPLALQRSQPEKADVRELLQPLSKAVPQNRTIVTDVPQLIAWYNDRKVMTLPEQVKSLADLDKTQKIGAIYLSGQGGNTQPMPNQWQQVYGRGLNIPGYQRATDANTRNVVYLKQPSLEETQEAVKAKPQNGAAYLALGQALLAKGEFSNALQAFNAAGRLQPKATAPLLGAGQAQLSLRNVAGAQVEFRKALQLEPRLTSALLGVAQIAQSDGKTIEAISLYEKVLADSPDHPIALNNLAQLYADKGNNLYRALEMVRRAAARNPQNGSILDTLAWVCYRIGYQREALTYAKRAAELSPDNKVIAEHLQKIQSSKPSN